MVMAPGWVDTRARAWELSRTARLPARWAAQFQKRFQEKKCRDSYAANVWLRDLSERMSAYRVPLNATDDDLRRIAAEAAIGAIDTTRLQPFGTVSTVTGGRVAMSGYCERWGIEAPGLEIEDRPAIARMTCPDWWLRKLRQVHARGLEGEAVRVGFVHRRADCYVSRESFERRQQQKRRVAAMLQSMVVENDDGQAYTLAELAAVSVANPAIRRGELMLRLAGFEHCARAAGDVAEFVTLTCPSAYHARLSADGAENPRYSGHTPKEAQQYLCKLWQRARAALHRRKLLPYGFRIAEPHHDGCPHWHMVLFMPAGRVEDFRAVMRRYALQVDGTEPGAQMQRVKFVAIDPAKGSAVGYVAKYISKNIDGMHVDEDLFGNPAVMAAARVEAWASTWGIRQFQQIGGPAVGVWRELRRVPADEVERVGGAVEAAWNAAQKTDTHKADFGEFIAINGGAVCKRADRPLQLAYTRPGERMNAANPAPANLTRYGDEPGRVVYGVRSGRRVVQSRRWTWRVVRKAASAALGVLSITVRGVSANGNRATVENADGYHESDRHMADGACACAGDGGQLRRASNCGAAGNGSRDSGASRGGG